MQIQINLFESVFQAVYILINCHSKTIPRDVGIDYTFTVL